MGSSDDSLHGWLRRDGETKLLVLPTKIHHKAKPFFLNSDKSILKPTKNQFGSIRKSKFKNLRAFFFCFKTKCI